MRESEAVRVRSSRNSGDLQGRRWCVTFHSIAPTPERSSLTSALAAEGMNVLTAVLRSGEEPRLTRAQMQRVHRASIAHKTYTDAHPDSDDDEGPEDDDAWLYEDLGLLAKLYARLRDRKQLIALIFEVRTQSA